VKSSLIGVFVFLLAPGASLSAMTLDQCKQALGMAGHSEEFLETVIPELSKQIIKRSDDVALLKQLLLDAPSSRLALKMNIEKTGHRFRKGGLSHPDHPARLAVLLNHVLRFRWMTSNLQQAMEEALAHDALEEGDGLSIGSIAKLMADYGSIPHAIRSAIVLTEPELDYKNYDPVYENYHKIEKIAVTLQTEMWTQRNLAIAKPTVAAFLADKLVNLFDDGYLASDLLAEERLRKLVLQISAIWYAHDRLTLVIKEIGDHSGGLESLHTLLLLSIHYKMAKFLVDPLMVEEEKEKLFLLEEQHRVRLRQEIAHNFERYDAVFPSLGLVVGLKNPAPH
jgi:hypothetical protein